MSKVLGIVYGIVHRISIGVARDLERAGLIERDRKCLPYRGSRGFPGKTASFAKYGWVSALVRIMVAYQTTKE